ncbi:BTB/POZ domain-containing protein [Aspergillus candidus]|uniref:POZ domain-containing protein n=1 Tax=Aspergillus candidus TaxID=41067 RepID=A0A2I2F400_ASPCN|nr:POZ domain-containing protein [Aspergillus candidus]PLB35372.1 POZ domain-containing protein [Aspergillus candidus]
MADWSLLMMGAKAPDRAFKRNLKRLYQDRRFSDLTLEAGPLKLDVHKAIISSQSDYFQALLSNNWAESTSRTIRLEDDDPESVKAMVQFMYEFDYDDSATDDTSTEEVHPTIFHIRVYKTADKYLIPELKVYALRKFLTATNTSKKLTTLLPQIIEEAYAATPASDSRLRRAVLELVLSNQDKLIRRDAFIEVIKNGGDFAVDFMREMSQVAARVRGFLCFKCGRKSYFDTTRSTRIRVYTCVECGARIRRVFY